MKGPIRVTRPELYKEIWSEPMRDVAQRHGRSDRGLAKLCQRHRIPRPGRGYWQKLRHGKKVKRTPLPALKPDQEHLATVTLRSSAPPRRPQDPPGPVEQQRAFEAKAENRIEVPERIGRYHPLVKQTQEALRFSKRGGGRRARPLARLDVAVEKKSLRRALRVMDTLIKALEKRGFEVSISSGEEPKTVVEVQGHTLQIRIEERYRRVELPPSDWSIRMSELHGWEARPRYDREPTGDLALKILAGRAQYVRKTWADGKKQRVESCLNAFVVGLVRAAEAKRIYEEELAERRRRREEERLAAEERRRKAREKQERIERLKRDAEAWTECERIRAYVETVRQRAEADRPLDPASDLARWLDWAESYVVEIDPLNRFGSGGGDALPRPGDSLPLIEPNN